MRETTSDKDAVSISFFADGKVKHAKVVQEGRIFWLGSMEFKSMVDMIEYYYDNPLYRKVKLNLPVTQDLLHEVESQGGGDGASDSIYGDSLYITPDTANQHGAGNALLTNSLTTMGVTVCATFAYKKNKKDELTFPIGAIITDVDTKDGGWWFGEYGGKKGWLPSNYVAEIHVDEQLAKFEEEDVDDPLGEMHKGSIHVTGGLRIEPRPSRPGMRLMFRITGPGQPDGGEAWIDVGTNNESYMKAWFAAVRKVVGQQQTKVQDEDKDKKRKIALDLSDLVFYMTSVKFKDWAVSAGNSYELMSSWGEKRAAKFCSEKGGNAMNVVLYNTRNVSRIYPKATRTNSSNYSPQWGWNCGSQLVALNYQTADRPMWINAGKFRVNGGCGYVGKPALLCDPRTMFDPYNHRSWNKTVSPVDVTITVLSGRSITKYIK